jgi:hypothetical protein
VVDQRWEIVLDGVAHIIELGRSGESPLQITHWFRVDGVAHGVRQFFAIRPAVSAFTVAGHPGTMTRRLIQEGFKSQLRRSYGWEWRNWKKVLTAGFFAGGVGVAGALDPPLPTETWVYTLKIDGNSEGSWVGVQRSQPATLGGRDVPAWHFEPSQRLADT